MEVDPAKLIRLIASLQPACCDAELVREVFGGATTDTLSSLATAFGVGLSAVKQWRASGLPGDAKQGQYSWGDCLTWWLEREAKRSQRKPAVDERQRRELEEIQLATEKANLEFRRARAAKWSSEFIPRRWVETELVTAFSVLRESIESIPTAIQCQLPKELEQPIRGEVSRACRRALQLAHTRLQGITADDNQASNGVLQDGHNHH